MNKPENKSVGQRLLGIEGVRCCLVRSATHCLNVDSFDFSAKALLLVVVGILQRF